MPTCVKCGRQFSRWQPERKLGTGMCAECCYSKSYVVTGSRRMDVICEKCGHEYDYMMEREGRGPTVEEAQENLVSILDKECDVVPCPGCNQVTKEMIDQRIKIRGEGLALVIIGLLLCGAVYLATIWFGRIFYVIGIFWVVGILAGLGKLIQSIPE